MNVVHVEDDQPLKEILKTTITALDPHMRLTQFTSADDALVYIEQNLATIDLYILDIRLPGQLNGLDLAFKIRELQSDGHIVMTSAFSRPSLEIMTKLRCEYYRKPWHLMELMQKLIAYRGNRNKTHIGSASTHVPVKD